MRVKREIEERKVCLDRKGEIETEIFMGKVLLRV